MLFLVLVHSTPPPQTAGECPRLGQHEVPFSHLFQQLFLGSKLLDPMYPEDHRTSLYKITIKKQAPYTWYFLLHSPSKLRVLFYVHTAPMKGMFTKLELQLNFKSIMNKSIQNK
jgi:hypothetical protein